MSELLKRTVFGALYVACVVVSILWSPLLFSGLFFLFCLIAVDEYHRLVKSSGSLRIFTFLATSLLWTLVQCQAWRTNDPSLAKIISFAALFAYIMMVIGVCIDEIWNHSGRPLQNWGNFLISQVMIAAPMSTMIYLYFLDKWLLLALFVLIWINDTGAYIVGSLTAKRDGGNHKMCPHVSPKKSWEGLIGGIVFTIIGSLVLYYCGWFDVISVGKWGLLIAVVYALLVSAFGTMGDLIESLMKRSVGVKDSGLFLPGHGGALDRFDSILLASPILTFFCWVCYYAVPLL